MMNISASWPAPNNSDMILNDRIKVMVPAYFSVVMATGIIGVACTLINWPIMAKFFLIINIVFFSALLIALLYRITLYKANVLADFHSYERGAGFLTLVPACCILGNQFILIFQHLLLAKILVLTAGILWLIMGYGLYFNVTVTNNKKSLKDGINGSWLLFVVAIQALSVLTSLLANDNSIPLFIALCFFFLGAVFYLYIMSLIIYRMSFFVLHADELGAPYWINMGATAITSLAGSMLIRSSSKFFLIAELLPFLKGLTLLFWAAGTWWIPLLLLLGVWKHIIKKIKTPVTAQGYDPSYWSLVFPLGMYTVSTFRLAEALKLPFLRTIADYFIYIAIVAWCAVFIGFLRNFYGRIKNI
ncbi:tellurite resistance/C4-dicarboxylate transporter family protein [Pedobacter rhizosphaerae]|uniref:Tellurite resistance protein TehA n=1 Tax=Pedobacter rhizosphaerae TaxID=390241 RepID=A0A1H9P7H2_9SPHI|nr:tellurite resistance/C4-dicarboxylate transporter family protein [Pedobacter rhizosphaerae]SER44148.1 Tellurite resistance protein TehA [Pedobacter rhizosphaerae]